MSVYIYVYVHMYVGMYICQYIFKCDAEETLMN